jgi:NAD(P)-dependent dehydrogenase (short-subunit alcohol dehydrogenase family)
VSNSLKGKTFIITGGSSGIGRASALLLSDFGARIIATGRDEKHIRETQAIDPTIHFLKTDLEKIESFEEVSKRIFEQTDIIHGFVHSAGVIYTELFETFRQHELIAMFRVNVQAGFEILRDILPLFREGGSVIFISSIDAFFAAQNPSSGYALTKGSLLALTNDLASELGKHNVRVNAIVPGLIKTSMTEGFFDKEFLEERDEFLKRVPLGRGGNPEEVANLIKFLLSDESSYITGNTIFCDGGYHIG